MGFNSGFKGLNSFDTNWHWLVRLCRRGEGVGGGVFGGAEGAEILGRKEKWTELTCWKW